MALDVDGLAHRVLDVPAQPADVVIVQWRAEAEEDEEELGTGREPLGELRTGWRVQLGRKPARERYLDRHGAVLVAVLVLVVQPLLFGLELVGRCALGRRPHQPAAHYRHEARAEERKPVLSSTSACRLLPVPGERRRLRAGGVRERMGRAMRHDLL
eukprot:1092770-Prymnesium_polylepis.2